MNKEIKILLADDHPIYREGLIKIIHKEKNLKVLYNTGNGSEALDIILNKKPNIAILDISMPGISGLEIVKIIFEKGLTTLPIILTMYDEEEYFEEAMENDVRGYLLKNSTEVEIIDCINSILKGNLYISKELIEVMIKGKKAKSNKEEILTLLNKLTLTEKEILRRLAQNKTSNQIANELFVSFRTIQNHRNNIAHKLGLSGHNKLLLFAIDNKSLL